MIIYKEQRIEKIYIKYKKLVVFVISKYISDKEVIKDITQDVFLNYIENENKVKRVQQYLTSTAKYMSLKYLNETNANDDVLNIDSLDENMLMLSHQSNIDFNLVIDDLKEILSIEEIEIIFLHIIYDYSFVEISLIKNKNYNNIKSVYRRAIIKCREKGVF